MKLFPKINKNKCKRCGNCIDVCPTKAMIRNSKKNIPEFKKRNCITCYCCHEMCHFHAIELKRNPLWDIIMTFYKKLLNYKSKNN